MGAKKMKNKFYFILAILLSSCGFYAFAMNTIDYVSAVFTTDEGVAVTIYDMSLIPADELVSDEQENSVINRFNFNRNLTTYSADNTLLSNSITNGLDVSVNFLYSNIYHERILKFGQTLTIEAKIINTSGANRTVTLYAALYNGNDILQSLASPQSLNIANTTEIQTLSMDYELPASNTDNYYLKTFIWDSLTMQPFANSVKLRDVYEDYYESTSSSANLIDYTKTVFGTRNSWNDTDYIRFIPDITSDFVFKVTCDYSIDVSLQLSNGAFRVMNDFNPKYFSYGLDKDDVYYLRVLGSALCDYSLDIFPVSSVYLNTGKTSAIAVSASDDCHIYKFTPTASGTYIFTSVGNTEVTATLYDGNFTLLQTDSTRDGAVSFRLSRSLQANKKYFIAVSPKTANSTGEYSLHVETPLTVTIN